MTARSAELGALVRSTEEAVIQYALPSGAPELAKLYALAAPNYAVVIESYEKAKDIGRQSKVIALASECLGAIGKGE